MTIRSRVAASVDRVLRRTRAADVLWGMLPSATKARVARSIGPVQLAELQDRAALVTEDVGAFLAALDLEVDPADLHHLVAAVREIDDRSAQVQLAYPTSWEVSARTEEALFLMVRALRPAAVVETGIGNGRSSAVMLAAMDLNGTGELHSVDVGADVGCLVHTDHRRWHRHITRGTIDDLRAVFAEAPGATMFVHDGDHSHNVQFTEYRAALECLPRLAILASDDVNWSNAFIDFCTSRGVAPAVLSEPSKYFGAFRVRT